MRKNNEKNMQNNIGCRRIDGLYDDAGRECNGDRRHRRKLAG